MSTMAAAATMSAMPTGSVFSASVVALGADATTHAAQESRPGAIPPNLLVPLPSTGGVPPITQPPGDPTAMLWGGRAEQRRYADRAREIRERYFRSHRPDRREAGMNALRAMNDPASFEPLIQAFSRAAPWARLALLDHFAECGAEGQAALAFIAITDRDPAQRAAATERIRRPVCDAALRVIDAALRHTTHDIVNSAGALAGNLNVLAAIPPMIFGQVADDPVRRGGDLAWIAIGTTKTYVANVVPIVGDNSGAFAPVIGAVYEGVVLRVQDAVAYSYRTDLHEALVSMTSADFGESTAHLGYDMRAWWQWFNEEYVPFKQRQAEALARLESSERQHAEARSAVPPGITAPEHPAPRAPESRPAEAPPAEPQPPEPTPPGEPSIEEHPSVSGSPAESLPE
ncbi:MAG: hypothetical protein KF724_13460 [Phycisphaeraceae bacterium]|nr:hypothetical protein [Phycisphaeraceae bacterium]